ncbi:putative Calcineurin like phosphoesterase [Trypanosoma vivax]|uniref:Serine/threonine-protein phosphatase n=1 Tax=Trypanosoma vivax (strain Y486) TaxID=1055687 RepID=G0U6U7_TRYVY|nr:putative serine/threonine protein phosphatase [Trypanosoma vivax]KAH8611419.1 putative Calcineurin like phosphoesterase [Trypanosoma vivax]CCC51602.1 putative serine/threonine protein phosphatase [Trypanosoma vivax Y486]
MGLFSFKKGVKTKNTMASGSDRLTANCSSTDSKDNVGRSKAEVDSYLPHSAVHGESAEEFEAHAQLPISDIVAFHTLFREALQQQTDRVERKRSVATLKSLALQMRKRDFDESGVSRADVSHAVVKYVLDNPPQIRARLALALHHFCSVVDWEMENEEIELGTGVLAAARNNLHCLGATSPSVDSEEKTDIFPRIANLDVESIHRKLLVESELPTMQEMAELLRRAGEVLRSEANVVVVPMPCVVVGDIHGHKKDLTENIFAAGGPLNLGSSPMEDGAIGEKPVKRNYLFLGDFVDRGPESLGCLALLLSAKLMAPRSVYLLRGNHESREVNRNYGFLKECWDRYPLSVREQGERGVDMNSNRSCDSLDGIWDIKTHPLWLLANEMFCSLPICAVITDTTLQGVEQKSGDSPDGTSLVGFTVCAMHGGLSPFIADSIDGILAVNRFREIVDGPLADVTWADPVSTPTLTSTAVEPLLKGMGVTDEDDEQFTNSRSLTMSPSGRFKRLRIELNCLKRLPSTDATVGFVFSPRGRGHNFGEDATLRFLDKSQMGFIVRAHQCVAEGYKWHHKHRLLTLFSAPNYCGLGNKGAVLILHGNGVAEVVQFEASSVREQGRVTDALPVPPKRFFVTRENNGV